MLDVCLQMRTLVKIWKEAYKFCSSHHSNNEEWCLLGCYAVKTSNLTSFQHSTGGTGKTSRITSTILAGIPACRSSSMTPGSAVYTHLRQNNRLHGVTGHGTCVLYNGEWWRLQATQDGPQFPLIMCVSRACVRHARHTYERGATARDMSVVRACLRDRYLLFLSIAHRCILAFVVGFP
jgi:hypothetical protein